MNQAKAAFALVSFIFALFSLVFAIVVCVAWHFNNVEAMVGTGFLSLWLAVGNVRSHPE